MNKAEIIHNGNVNLQKESLRYYRLLGNFIGTLEGITAWDIPQALQIKLRKQIGELKKNPAVKAGL